MPRLRKRDRGSALITVVAIGAGLMILVYATLETTQIQSTVSRAELETFKARTAAHSAVNEALTRVRYGLRTPGSGSAITQAAAKWVKQGTDCDYYYYTNYNSSNSVYTIRAWGRARTRITSGSLALQPTVAPDSGTYNFSGWRVQGFEVVLQGKKYIPNAPIYMANGAIELPRGGIDNSSTPGFENNPVATWPRVGTGTSSGDSYQSNDIPFRVDARNHPADFLTNGWGGPAPTVTGQSPYNIFTVQNQVGQEDVKAWFNTWSGSPASGGASGVYPDPNNSSYWSTDPTSPNYPFNVDTSVPRVATFGFELWSKYNADATTGYQIGGNGATSPTLSTNLTVGTSTSPKVVFATGKLTVPAGKTLTGYGILVIRDDYDPNAGGNNQPGSPRQAALDVQGNLNWTGLVIVAGWAPNITMNGNGAVAVNGALFGEDRVQSGGEQSATAATIQMYIGSKNGTSGVNTTTGAKCFMLNYCRSIFEPGGLVYPLMPETNKTILSFKEL